jgi:DNA-directed RNA polymerase subunit A'
MDNDSAPGFITHLRWGLVSGDEVEREGLVRVSVPRHDLCDTIPDENDPTKQPWFSTLSDRRMGAVGHEKCFTCHEGRDGCAGHFGYIDLKTAVLPPHFAPHVKGVLEKICMSSPTCGGVFLSNSKKVCSCCNGPRPTFVGMNRTHVVVTWPENTERPETALCMGDVQRFLKSKPSEVWKALKIQPTKAHPAWCIWTKLLVLPLNARPYRHVDGAKAVPDPTTVAYRRVLIRVQNVEESADSAEMVRFGAVAALHDEVATLILGASKTGMPGEKSSENARVMRRVNEKTSRAVAHALSGGSRKRASKTEAQRSLASRLAGKHGRVRGDCLGNRTDQSLRAVITGTDELELDEVGIPVDLARRVTKPIRATPLNLSELREMVRSEKDTDPVPTLRCEFSGSEDAAIRTENATALRYQIRTRRFAGGTAAAIWLGDERDVESTKAEHGLMVKRVTISGVDYVVTEKNREARAKLLRVGDLVHRRLRDGDRVLFNRQPSLHPGSMMAFRVRVLLTSSLMMRPENNESFNADYDGDEMNVFVPQTPQAEAEMAELCGVEHNIMKIRPGLPNLALMQNALVGSFLLSDPGVLVSEETMFDMAARGNLWPKDILHPTFLMPMKPESTRRREIYWSGPAAFSATLPAKLNWSSGEKGDSLEWFPSPPSEKEREAVLVRDGTLLTGRITKKHVGPSTGGFVEHMYKTLGSSETMAFLNRAQPMVAVWLSRRGFTTSRDDLRVKSDTARAEISEVITKGLERADEDRIALVGGRAKADMFWSEKAQTLYAKTAELTLRALRKENPENEALAMVVSGSKGKESNAVQMTAWLGLQTVGGAMIRAPQRMVAEKDLRLTPHFESENASLTARGVGFVSSNFSDGLSLRDALVHARAGRSGVVDTALRTPKAGYLQRSLKERLQNLVVAYDGRVRDTATGNVVQHIYGGLGVDADDLWKLDNEREGLRGGDARPVDPGTPVGTRAALDAAHAVVQGTMNTFKFVGQLQQEKKELERLMEILQVPKTQSEVVLVLHCVSPEASAHAAEKLKSRALAHYTLKMRVVFPDPVGGGGATEPWVQRWDAAFTAPTPAEGGGEVELTFSGARLARDGVHFRNVVSLVRKALPAKARVKHTNLSGWDDAPPTIRVRPAKAGASPAELHKLGLALITKCTVRGHTFFRAVDASGSEVRVFVDPTQAAQALRSTWSLRGVHHNKTECSHIQTIYKVFGIQAARQAILKELRTAMGGDISELHLGLLADAMTRDGAPRTVRSGGVPPKTSVAARAGYDQELKRFVAGALSAKRNSVRDVPSARIVGARVPLGTGGDFAVRMDFDLLSKIPERMEEEENAPEEAPEAEGAWWAPSASFVRDLEPHWDEPVDVAAAFSPMAPATPPLPPLAPSTPPVGGGAGGEEYSPSSPTYAPASPLNYSPSSPFYSPHL